MLSYHDPHINKYEEPCLNENLPVCSAIIVFPCNKIVHSTLIPWVCCLHTVDNEIEESINGTLNI